VRNQAGPRFEQAAASIERGLQDLFFQWLVPDDLGHQQVSALRQLDLPRPARDEGDAVGHPVRLAHARGDRGDVTGFHGVDAPGARPGYGHGQDPAAGADVEHDVAWLYRGSQRGDEVTGPAVIVEHTGMLDRISPAAGGRAAARYGDQRVLLDEHVDHVHRRREVSRAAELGLEPIERVTKRQRAREHRQDRESPGPDIHNRPDRRVDNDMTSCIQPRAEAGRELQHRVRGQTHLRQSPRTSSRFPTALLWLHLDEL
jgi:hypothetical protein